MLTGATVAWNLAEGAVAVSAGMLSSSVALIGFGVDSFIETASAAVVCWRLVLELRGQAPERVAQVERATARIAGALLLALAAYLTVDAARRLLGFGAEAEKSGVGLALTAVSLLLMPWLGKAKLRVSRALGSAALRADAQETLFCAWLSLTTLAGLALNALFGWAWADPLAALVLVPFVAREGLEGWRGGCCACGHDDG